jgi:hypothetical protein
MGSNKRDLKAYVRYDGSGRVVAGSLILRRQKPKVGNWTEVQGYECCNPVLETVLTFADPTFVDPAIQILCGTVVVFQMDFTGTTFGTIGELVTALNESLATSFLGTFSADDVTLVLTMSNDLVKILCPTGTISMEVTTIT